MTSKSTLVLFLFLILSFANGLSGRLIDQLIPSVVAADLLAESTNPTVSSRNSDAGDFAWDLQEISTGQMGIFTIYDRVGANGDPVIRVFAQNGGHDNTNSLVFDVEGGISWANFAMNFDRGAGALSIGTQLIGGELRISPGSPWENGYCESFNARMRDELRNGEIFYTLKEAQVLIEDWRVHDNTKRPHSALGYRPPAPEAIRPKTEGKAGARKAA